jgi:hypothetical protein
MYFFFVQISFVSKIQSEQKENKSEQALQIMGHVVAESYPNKRSVHTTYFIIKNISKTD